MGRFLTILALVLAASMSPADSFSVQKKASEKFLLENISRADTLPGVIVASPSTDAPNYYFHWVRDAALTADAVINLKEKSFDKVLYDYVTLSRRNQTTINLSGGLGEPKFNVDGSAYNEPWGRPQSDGPALRVIALVHFAANLLGQGQEEYVRKNLYDHQSPTNSVIKADLEYLETSWKNSCFDIWEETKGNHFYTMMVQRRAFVEGALLADKLGDTSGAQRYRQQVAALTEALGGFWSPERGYIFESQNQVSVHSKAGLDTAVVLAVLHGYANDNFYSPADDKILATIVKLRDVFQNIYKVNTVKDTVGLIGRYAEDTYDGIGDSQGNPWFITTFAFAELMYRASSEFKHKEKITITNLNRDFFKFVSPKLDVAVGDIIINKDLKFDAILSGMNLKGDQYMQRALNFAGSDGSMSEEINRDSGVQQGARNLTWSHASFLTALGARAQ